MLENLPHAVPDRFSLVVVRQSGTRGIIGQAMGCKRKLRENCAGDEIARASFESLLAFGSRFGQAFA